MVLALSILGVVVAGLSATPPAAAAAPAVADKAAPLFSGLALIFILLTYGGWNEAAYLTAEMRDTKRGIVRALIIGILIITALYLLLNYAYLNALGLAGMRESKAVATDLMKVTWGDAGALVLGAAVVAAALSTLNATIFTGARTNYALGRDFALFGFLGKWHERPARRSMRCCCRARSRCCWCCSRRSRPTAFRPWSRTPRRRSGCFSCSPAFRCSCCAGSSRSTPIRSACRCIR